MKHKCICAKEESFDIFLSTLDLKKVTAYIKYVATTIYWCLRRYVVPIDAEYELHGNHDKNNAVKRRQLGVFLVMNDLKGPKKLDILITGAVFWTSVYPVLCHNIFSALYPTLQQYSTMTDTYIY